jgi:N-acetylglutamate synthase
LEYHFLFVGHDIRGIEERAFAAWPAEQVGALGRWRFRSTRGVTHRGNSVWPDGLDGIPSLEAGIEAAERFYAEHSLPALFQLTPLAPPGLDQALEARGYTPGVSVSVQVAAVNAMPPPPRSGSFTRTMSEDWFSVSGRLGRYAQVPEIYAALLARIGSRAVFAQAERDGRIASVGLGVVDPPWLGISSMFTLPSHRGHGLGQAVLAALAAAAGCAGCEHLYLQVDRDNPSALALYSRCGFREAYGYAYRGHEPR